MSVNGGGEVGRGCGRGRSTLPASRGVGAKRRSREPCRESPDARRRPPLPGRPGCDYLLAAGRAGPLRPSAVRTPRKVQGLEGSISGCAMLQLLERSLGSQLPDVNPRSCRFVGPTIVVGEPREQNLTWSPKVCYGVAGLQWICYCT